MLRWSADMKGTEFSTVATRMIRLSRKLCDGKSSDRRRLETIFDAFCKKAEGSMNPYEFSSLCHSLGLFRNGKFCIGDVYEIFQKARMTSPDHPALTVDFDGFMQALSLVGVKLGIGQEVHKVFAAGVTKLNMDAATIRKVKLRIKHAASSASTSGWRQFFRECDEDNSGNMDWLEFIHMCRNKLFLTDRENHLKILFEKLDEDDSGELSIDELIEFLETS